MNIPAPEVATLALQYEQRTVVFYRVVPADRGSTADIYYVPGKSLGEVCGIAAALDRGILAEANLPFGAFKPYYQYSTLAHESMRDHDEWVIAKLVQTKTFPATVTNTLATLD